MKESVSLSIVAALILGGASLFAQNNEKVYLVHTGKPFRQTIAQSIKKTGGLVSPAEVSISAKVGGRLLKLELADGTRLDEGVRVKKGDRIAEIESRDYKAQFAAAQATVASAEATVKDTKREFERADTLYKQGTATEQERDLAEAQYERAQAALAQAKAQAEIAKINLDECVIYSPMDGVISKRAIEPGSLLSVGTEIAVVTQLKTLRFQISIPTTLFSNLAVGKTPISIEVDAYPGQPVLANISRIYPVADDVTRTVRVEAIIDNSDGRFVPGMYAVATIDLDRRENVLCVPFEAVVRNDRERLIYRVKDGVAQAVKVKLGIRSDAVVEVLEGISEGDEIVVAGQHRLTDGAKVKLEDQQAN